MATRCPHCGASVLVSSDAYCSECRNELVEEKFLADTPLLTANQRPNNRSFSARLFSFHGRATRTEFWAIYGGSLAILVAAAGKISVFLIALCLVLIPIFAVRVRRWHDLNMSGAWILISLIPVFGGLFAAVMQGFVAGTNGPNDYGLDPKVPPDDLQPTGDWAG